MKRICFIISVLYFLPAALRAGNADTRPAPFPIDFTGLEAPDSVSFIMPFSRVGNLILIQAKADTTEGNFILDTGCPGLVLNLTYFRDYPHTDVAGTGSGISAGEFGVSRTMVKDLAIGPVHFSRINCDMTNLGSLENSRGVKILGLIGVEIFLRFEVIIDFEKNQISMHRIHRKESSTYRHVMLEDTASYYEVPVRTTDNRIIVETELAGKKIKLIMDSGAETNLLDSRLPDRVFEKVSVTGRSTLLGVGAKRVDVLTGDLDELTLGDQRIANLPILITNLEKTCFSHGGCVDGVLGLNSLSQKKIGFNFVTGTMYIWK